MLAVIEDNDCDYEFYKRFFLFDIKHVRFCNMSNFIESGLKFSCILSDINLTDSLYGDTIRNLKKHTSNPIFIITGTGGVFLTGSSFSALVDSGADDVFEKNKMNDSRYAEMINEMLKRALEE